MTALSLGVGFFLHSSATPLKRCRGAPSCPFLRLSIGERERSAEWRTETCSPCEGEPAALAIGPLANRRSTAVFWSYRAVLPNRTGYSSHPDPGGNFGPPFSPARRAALSRPGSGPCGPPTDLPVRQPSIGFVKPDRTGHRSRLRRMTPHEAPSTGRDAANMLRTRKPSKKKFCTGSVETVERENSLCRFDTNRPEPLLALGR